MINNVIMDDTKKMLRAVINGQSAIKEELLEKISGVDKKLDNLEKKVDGGFQTVNERIDKLGKSLAYLEDDTPTKDEFDGLANKVDKIEKNFVSV